MDKFEKTTFIVLLLPLPILFIYMINKDAKRKYERQQSIESDYLKYESSGHIRKYFDKNFNLVYYKSAATYYREAYYMNGNICVDSIARDYYKSSGKLQFEGHIKSESPDVLIGKGIWYYENGNISGEAFHDKDGLTQGISILYYEDGAKECESYYKDDKLEGLSTFYYENGKKEFIQKYKNGKLEGENISYYTNGEIKSKINFKNGEKSGISTYYYESGEKQFIRNYIHNKIEGIAKDYYENGKIKETRTYKNNTLTGEWKTFYENGCLQSKGQAENGKKIGIWEYYDLNGNISYRNESKVYCIPKFKLRSENRYSSLLSECEELSAKLEDADIDHEEPSSYMNYHELQNLRDEYESLLEENNIDY